MPRFMVMIHQDEASEAAGRGRLVAYLEGVAALSALGDALAAPD